MGFLDLPKKYEPRNVLEKLDLYAPGLSGHGKDGL